MTAQRILDISEDNLHIHAERGFLVLSRHKERLARVAVDQIDAVVVHSHGVTYSNNLLVRLAENGCSFVICGANHSPMAQMVAIENHHRQAERIDLQVAQTTRLKGRVWKELIIGKVIIQSKILKINGKTNASGLAMMAKRVKNGDPDNIEAQAAKKYWQSLFGEAFRRRQDMPGINGMLNYGYIILRSLVSRKILAVGLLPSLGVHHSNKNNPMRLVDDMMEPIRPFVDNLVYDLVDRGIKEVNNEVKQKLGRLGHQPVKTKKLGVAVTADMSNAIETMLYSFISILEGNKGHLILPEIIFQAEFNFAEE